MEAGASVIAFVQAAGAVVKCIVKTKQLWDELKDLPRELNDLVEDVEAFEVCFREVESHYNDPRIPEDAWDDALAKRSLHHCRRALNILEDLAKDLNSQVKSKKGFKKKLVLVKAYTKQELLTKYQARLERCILYLNMSTQSYQISLIKVMPELVSRQVTSDLLPQFNRLQFAERKTIQISNETQIDNTADRTKLLVRSHTVPTKPITKGYAPSRWGRFGMEYTNGAGGWRASFQYPSWMSQSIFELNSNPTLCGWSYNYRVYNIISPESEVIAKIKQGDRDGVLDLFRTRKASPFDKDDEGYSLLHYAADWNRYEICQELLKLGLQELLDEVVGRERSSPLTSVVYVSRNSKPDPDTEKITQLFQSYLSNSESISVGRLFDFVQEWAYGDVFVSIFREKFLPKFYTGPIRNRLEAVRLGSFHMLCPSRLMELLNDSQPPTSSDIKLSTHENLSLVHSAATAMGIRFADEVMPYRRAEFQWRIYNDSWSHVARIITSVADSQDLHTIETVFPWDVYHVPSWRGTPLVSVIGGALCYLSPEVSFFYWDKVFQETLRQWLRDIKAAGIDLVTYGQHETFVLKRECRGALDADAVERSRTEIRDSMAWSAANLKVKGVCKNGWNANHWVPVRLIDLKIGPCPDDWRIIWAPEFEFMAFQFWQTMERDTNIMPGAWVDD